MEINHTTTMETVAMETVTMEINHTTAMETVAMEINVKHLNQICF